MTTGIALAVVWVTTLIGWNQDSLWRTEGDRITNRGRFHSSLLDTA